MLTLKSFSIALSWLIPVASGFSGEWTAQRHQQTLPLRGATHISIENGWGDVRLRIHDQHDVMVIANEQQVKEIAVPYKLEKVEKDGALAIKAVFATLDKESKDYKKHRVDLTVLLPAQVPVEVTTHRGMIEAKGMKQALHLRSRLGAIKFQTNATVDIETFQGNIEGQLFATSPKADSRLVSTHGLISVWIPKDADYSATLETERLISSDFSVQISFLNDTTKQGKAKIAAGKQALTIKSRRGDVRLLRLPSAGNTQ